MQTEIPRQLFHAKMAFRQRGAAVCLCIDVDADHSRRALAEREAKRGGCFAASEVENIGPREREIRLHPFLDDIREQDEFCAIERIVDSSKINGLNQTGTLRSSSLFLLCNHSAATVARQYSSVRRNAWVKSIFGRQLVSTCTRDVSATSFGTSAGRKRAGSM